MKPPVPSADALAINEQVAGVAWLHWTIATGEFGRNPPPKSATESPSSSPVNGPARSVAGGGSGASGSNVSGAPACSA